MRAQEDQARKYLSFHTLNPKRFYQTSIFNDTIQIQTHTNQFSAREAHYRYRTDHQK
jgi:hypothetical protein